MGPAGSGPCRLQACGLPEARGARYGGEDHFVGVGMGVLGENSSIVLPNILNTWCHETPRDTKK